MTFCHLKIFLGAQKASCNSQSRSHGSRTLLNPTIINEFSTHKIFHKRDANIEETHSNHSATELASVKEYRTKRLCLQFH